MCCQLSIKTVKFGRERVLNSLHCKLTLNIERGGSFGQRLISPSKVSFLLDFPKNIRIIRVSDTSRDWGSDSGGVRLKTKIEIFMRKKSTKRHLKITNLERLKSGTVKGRMIELSVLWGILWKIGYLDITPVWHETGNLAKFDIFNLDSFRFVISPSVRVLAMHQLAF